MLNFDPDKGTRTIGPRFVGRYIWRRPGYAADVVRVGFYGLEEDNYIASRETDGGVAICENLCQGFLDGRVSESVGWMVEDPERHCSRWIQEQEVGI